MVFCFVFFFQAEDGIRDGRVTGVQTCALPIYGRGDLQAVGLQHPGQAVPQQEEVFGDDNAQGISMVTAVGPPGGLLMARTPRSEERRVGKEWRSVWAP